MKKLLLALLFIFFAVTIVAFAMPSEKGIIAEFNESRMMMCPNQYIIDFFDKDHIKTASKYKGEPIVTIAGNFNDGSHVISMFAYVKEEFVPILTKVSKKHDFKDTKIPASLKDADLMAFTRSEDILAGESQVFGVEESMFVYLPYCPGGAAGLFGLPATK